MYRTLLLSLTFTICVTQAAEAQIVPGKVGGAESAAVSSPIAEATPAKSVSSSASDSSSETVAAATVSSEPVATQAQTKPETDQSSSPWKDGGKSQSSVAAAKEPIEFDDPFATDVKVDTSKFQSAPEVASASSNGAVPSAMVSEKPQTTSVPGINTSGTVRVENLQNAEALFNVLANGLIALGIAWAGPSLMMSFFRLGASEQGAMKHVMHVILGLLGLIAMPAVINWLVASGRDAGIFLGL